MSDDKQFYAIIEGKTVGPLTPQELIDLGLRENHYVWKPGMEQWLPAIQIEELDTFFNTECVPPPPPEAAFMQESHNNDKPGFWQKISGLFKRDNQSSKSIDKSGRSIKIGIWILVVSAVFSLWMSFQGMFLFGRFVGGSVSNSCFYWAWIIIIVAVIYFIIYCKYRKRKLLYITIGLLLTAIFPAVRLIVTYNRSYYEHFIDGLIALTDNSNTVSIYDKWGHEVARFDGDNNAVYISENTSDFVVISEDKAFRYNQYGHLGATNNIEASDTYEEGFSYISFAVSEFFGCSFKYAAGGNDDLEYIKIDDGNTNQAPEEAVPAEVPAGSSSSNESSSYEKTNERRSESDSHHHTAERHETQVPMQVWKQCMSCLGTGQCNYCYGQGVYNDYTGTHDCPCCINGRCGICAGQGGHYEVEYETRVDYY